MGIAWHIGFHDLVGLRLPVVGKSRRGQRIEHDQTPVSRQKSMDELLDQHKSVNVEDVGEEPLMPWVSEAAQVLSL